MLAALILEAFSGYGYNEFDIKSIDIRHDCLTLFEKQFGNFYNNLIVMMLAPQTERISFKKLLTYFNKV